MKVEDFAYNVASRALELLEINHHYKVPEKTRDEILAQILSEVDQLLKKGK